MSRLSQYATGLAVLAGALFGAPLACFSAEPVEWLFDQASEVVSTSNLKNDRVENGALAGVTEWDPYVALRCPKEGVDASQLTWLTVRMYSSDDADLLDVYYKSPEGLWCLGGKLPVRKGWATYRLDLNNNSWRETTAGDSAKQWGGTSKRVNAFRLDPGNQAGRWVVIDRVRLEPPQADFVEGVIAEPRGSASLRALRTPEAVEEGGRLAVSATFDVTVPAGLSNGTAYLRLHHGSAVLSVKETPVAFAGKTLNVAAEFPVSRYWNSGALTVEAGCYELDGAAATARVAFANSRIGRVKPPVCELRRVGGDVAFFVNGQPMPGVLYLASGGLHPDRHREAAQAGVHVYSDWFGTSRHADMGHVAPDTYDYGEYDRYFAAILKIDPDALFLPHIGLSGPLWWQKAHPEEMSLREDGAREPTSFASELWKREMGDDLRKLIAYLRQAPYADRIIGYIVYSGYTAEWQMWGTWQPSRDDYSQPALRAFRAFLLKRYGTDEKLRAAWADGAVTLTSAEMPRWDKRRPAGTRVLRDPATERQAIDFYEFISTMTSDAILHFARIARDATEGKSLVGTYYAYLTAHGINQQDSGHVAAQRVFDSPDIDFLMSPPNYGYRKPGETSTFMSATDSLRMRGKLWLDESDHRTFLSESGAGYGRAETLAETLGVFRREFAEVLTKRAAVSWFDMGGGWFSHPAILAEMGRTTAVMKQSLSCRQPFQPEIGVFVDPDSFYWMRSTAANAALVLNQIVTMPQTGAPWDFCLLSDIADERMPDYKLYVFLNAFRADDARREAIQRKLRRNHATALFVYAPGYFGTDGASLANMRALTGIRIAKDEAGGAPQVVLDANAPLAQGLSSGEAAGAKLTVSPLFYADEHGAQVVGRLVGCGRPGLVVKRLDGWTSIYSAAMTLPPALMRRIARQAGVHIWLESDDALYTDGRFIGVHAAADGTKRVSLPFVGQAADGLNGTALSCDGRTVTFEMKRAETVLLEVQPQ
ncbi:MAG TPA: beta-galactosidase [Kiritimatiellia bacterium]|nr:beta-galactosidase [Kiritimatiellia bacterium]HPS08098.1 beta-galactosidase [Kiritimatiellia bacterium]